MPTKFRFYFLKNRLTPLIIMVTLVMVGFAMLLYLRVDDMILNSELNSVSGRADECARIYSQQLYSELDKIGNVAKIIESTDPKDEDESIEMAVSYLEGVYGKEPNVFVGLISANGKALYGDMLSASNYEGIMTSLRGRGGISYTSGGGVLFSYPVCRGSNVRYVIYELCTSGNFASRFPVDSLEESGHVGVMTRNGQQVVPFVDVPSSQKPFYQSRSLQREYEKLVGSMDLQSTAAVYKDTTLGPMFLYVADVAGTDFVLAGTVDRDSVSAAGISTIPRLVLSVTLIMAFMVMMLAFFLMISSQRVRESEALKKAKIAAEDASKAKTDFLANMSHEIRTPINTILGFDEMILRESKDKLVRGHAMNIQSAGRMLLSLINDVLDFSRIESGHLELVLDEYDLAVMITDMVTIMRSRAVAKGLEFNLDVDERVPRMLMGDNVRLRQIIINLLTNAVKYTEEGSVTFSVSGVRESGEDYLLRVEVTDTGIGIHEDDLKRLYDAFERFDEGRNRTIEGTGLGMNIVKQLLELMGSTPEVESVYGQGSTFAFSVRQKVLDWTPIGNIEDALEESLDEEPTTYRSSFAAPEARILLVDDTEMNLLVIKGLLQTTQIEIDTASDGLKALEMTKEKEYDLLLIDHRMPVMDGVQMMVQLRVMEDNPNSKKPCIALTANAVAGARQTYLAVGFDDYLVKPVNSKRLEQMLVDYLPPEKVLTSEVTVEEMTGELPLFEALERDADLDTKEGIEYSGSEDLYIMALKFFRDTADDKAKEIRTCYENENWKDYTTRVHGLKSSARVIGAASLSDQAKALEFAGKDEDYDYIRAHTDEVLEYFLSYKEKLKGVE